MTALRVLPAGDSAVLLRLGDTIDPAVNARVLRIAEEMRSRPLPGLREAVVGYASVTVYFDPLVTEIAAIESWVRERAEHGSRGRASRPRQVTIPARYGGESGPDLSELAAFARCSEQEVVNRHVGREYRVFMVGFLPGFPYMGIVDERIAMPRRDTPRFAVPAGSIGIAGQQTGIYPVQSPGGWRIIGRTEEPMFDVSRASPSLLQPGDIVRFIKT